MTNITAQQAQEVLRQADCLVSAQEVENALEKLAQEISGKLTGRDPLVLCVMTGAMIPAGQLLLHLDFPLQLDYIHVSRYRGKTVGGELHWVVKPRVSLKDRVVLVFDDILDEGLTLKAIIDACRSLGACEVYSAVLVNKRTVRKIDVTADFIGLEVEDRYVFGSGMDYKGYLRNVPGIYAEKE